VSAPELDHDSQRELERRALQNVHRLAERLGYRDALDRLKEKRLLVAIGAFTAIAVVVLVTLTMLSGPPQAETERLRCSVAVRAEKANDMRSTIAREHPELGDMQREQQLERDMQGLIASACPAGSKGP